MVTPTKLQETICELLGLPLEDVSPRAIISIFEHSMRSLGEKVEQLSAAMSILRVPNQRTITVEEIEKAKEDGVSGRSFNRYGEKRSFIGKLNDPARIQRMREVDEARVSALAVPALDGDEKVVADRLQELGYVDTADRKVVKPVLESALKMNRIWPHRPRPGGKAPKREHLIVFLARAVREGKIDVPKGEESGGVGESKSSGGGDGGDDADGSSSGGGGDDGDDDGGGDDDGDDDGGGGRSCGVRDGGLRSEEEEQQSGDMDVSGDDRSIEEEDEDSDVLKSDEDTELSEEEEYDEGDDVGEEALVGGGRAGDYYTSDYLYYRDDDDDDASFGGGGGGGAKRRRGGNFCSAPNCTDKPVTASADGRKYCLLHGKRGV